MRSKNTHKHNHPAMFFVVDYERDYRKLLLVQLCNDFSIFD